MNEKIKTMLAAVVKQASPSGRYESPWGFKGANGGAIFLTPKMLAMHLKVSQKTLERMRQRGDGPPFIKIGMKQIRYPVKPLDEWVGNFLKIDKTDPE